MDLALLRIRRRRGIWIPACAGMTVFGYNLSFTATWTGTVTTTCVW